MNRIANRLFAAALALGFLLPAQGAALAAAKVVAASGAPLVVDVSKGELVHLDHPINTVFVADPDIADVQVKSPTLVYVFGKAGGETTLFAVGENDQVVLNMTVQVRYDVSRVQEAIHHAVPRSAVAVSSLGKSLVIEGTVYSAAEGDDVRRVAERFLNDPKLLVNKVKVEAPNQVQLRVRIAEVSRTVVKDLGFNWDAFSSTGNFLFGLATGHSVVNNFVVPAAGAQTFNTRVPSNGSTTNSLIGGFNAGRTDVNALIDALDSEGLVTMLAEPNLSAISGEPASFLAGGEFPIPFPSGLGTVSVEFKNYGVSLNFVATITGSNRINIHVKPEVSQLSSSGSVTIDGTTVPALTVRRAETTIDVASGQSFAIAGLLQNNITQTLSKFPWVGDVPVLGQLFRSQAFQRGETELVIIVTPYIVRPVATPNMLQLPTDGFVAASDRDMVIDGADSKAQDVKHASAPANRQGTGLIGPVGFELE